MIVIHKSEYNPRIDFIVCKQLLCNLPYVYDELKLRECFENEAGELPYERDMIAIKNFFKTTDAAEATTNDVEVLYGICAHESVKFDGAITDMNGLDDLERLAKMVAEYDCNKVTLFQILMLFGYCKINEVPIMPYHGVCAKIYYSLLSGNRQRAERSWQDLLYRKNKYSIKHPIEQNAFCVSQIQEYKDEFLKITGAEKLPLHFDICVSTESGMANLPIGIRRTVKFL